MTNNQIKFNWNIKENKKNVLEIYDHEHVINSICKMANRYNAIEVMNGKDTDWNNEITINFDGHYSHILENVAVTIDTLRAYITYQKGSFDKVEEVKKED
jgi:hypothetical protein